MGNSLLEVLDVAPRCLISFGSKAACGRASPTSEARREHNRPRRRTVTVLASYTASKVALYTQRKTGNEQWISSWSLPVFLRVVYRLFSLVSILALILIRSLLTFTRR